MQATEPVIETESNPYVAAFDEFEATLRGNEPAWVLPLRKSGLARFAESGLPTVKCEDWRFTSLKALASEPFRPSASAEGAAPAKLDELPCAKLDCHRMVFVDGKFDAGSSSLPSLDGIVVTKLQSSLSDQQAIAQQFFGQSKQDPTNPFQALSDAYFQDGAFIHIAKGKSLDKPIVLAFLTTTPETTTHPRNLVIAEEGSSATIIELNIGQTGEGYFSNALNEFVVRDNAAVEHIKFQDESEAAFHIATNLADLGRDTRFHSHSFALGAKLSRNNLRTLLNGEGLNCVLNGLYYTSGDRLADHHMIVEHAKPHCESHEYFNGVLDDKSRGVFHGRILVQQEAQKTDAKQTNKNLLLSDDATANTKPQLEIYADDVKCTHGATIGQMSDEQIFYLRARGIDLPEARRMLIHAFASEIIDRIQCAEVQDEIDRIVWDRLQASTHV